MAQFISVRDVENFINRINVDQIITYTQIDDVTTISLTNGNVVTTNLTARQITTLITNS